MNVSHKKIINLVAWWDWACKYILLIWCIFLSKLIVSTLKRQNGMCLGDAHTFLAYDRFCSRKSFWCNPFGDLSKGTYNAEANLILESNYCRMSVLWNRFFEWTTFWKDRFNANSELQNVAVIVEQFLFGTHRDIGSDHSCQGNGRNDSNQNRVKRINKKARHEHGYIW